MRFEIHDYGRKIFSADCYDIMKKIVGSNRFMIRDIELMFAYFRGLSSPDFEKNGIIIADISSIESMSVLDVRATEAVFWLSSVMREYNVIDKIGKDNFAKVSQKMMIFINAYNKSNEINLKSMRKINQFTGAVVKGSSDIRNGVPADVVVEGLIDMLPDKKRVALEISRTPQFEQVFERIEELAALCSDEKYLRAVLDYRAEIRSILKK